MNILFLSTRSPYPLISGHSLRTYHILRGAAEKHNVTLVTFKQLAVEAEQQNLDHLRNFCRGVFQFQVPVDSSKVKLAAALLINLFSPLPFVAKKYDCSLMRQQIREILSAQEIDLVHVDLLPLSVYVNEFKSLPKLLVNHNVESVRLRRWSQNENNLMKKAFLWLQWQKLKRFERNSLHKFDGCVVVSDIDKLLLTKLGVKARMFVVPNGTDTNFFRPQPRETIESSVVWIGHMDVHTNRDAVLYFWHDIYPILRNAYSALRMIFVGTNPPSEIAKAAQNDPQVTVTGFVDDIRSFLSEAAVVVVPVRIGSGTRLKILDAMAMGKAIVSTTVGAEGLNIAPGVNILIADSPQEFVSKTIELLQNSHKREYLGRNARELALTYDWKSIQETQDQIYRQLTKGAVS